MRRAALRPPTTNRSRSPHTRARVAPERSTWALRDHACAAPPTGPPYPGAGPGSGHSLCVRTSALGRCGRMLAQAGCAQAVCLTAPGGWWRGVGAGRAGTCRPPTSVARRRAPAAACCAGDHTRCITVSTPSSTTGGIMRFAKVRRHARGCASALPPSSPPWSSIAVAASWMARAPSTRACLRAARARPLGHLLRAGGGAAALAGVAHVTPQRCRCCCCRCRCLFVAQIKLSCLGCKAPLTKPGETSLCEHCRPK